MTGGLTLLALAGGALVLALDPWPGFLAIAVGYLVLQIRLRPPAHELLKRPLLSIAFIFWSASQVDPASG